MNKDMLKNPDIQKLVVLFLLFCVLFWPGLRQMYAVWTEDSNNSHGLLIPFIVAYLVYETLKTKKSALDVALNRPKTAQMAGLAGLVISVLLFFIGMLTDIAVFKNFFTVTAFQSLVLFVFGWALCRLFVFPLLFLVFMIPIPTTIYGAVALPMQLFATKVSVFFLKCTPLPVSAEGNIIRVGDEMLTVAEACSGLRSLMSFIIISLLFAYLAKIRFWKKSLMVALSVPVAIVGNVLRIIVLTFVAYLYGARTAINAIHDVSGYVMFVIAFGIFLWLARALENSEKI
jgi:exosortase